MHRKSSWKKEPATEKQLDYLERLGINFEDDDSLSKYDASALIDKATGKSLFTSLSPARIFSLGLISGITLVLALIIGLPLLLG